MKRISLILVVSLPIYASGYPDKSSLDTIEMAKCAAAALKLDRETWLTWHDALHERYKQMYKGRKSGKQIEDYTIERVLGKNRALMRAGIDSKHAYRNYWNINCKDQL